MKKLKLLDLFSGIGGFSLGLERTGGFETVAFCEIEKFPQQVLKKHWPDVPIYEDVRILDYEKLKQDGICKIDIITGGFPCQDISVAGKQKGINSETRSGLWSEILRLTREIRPQYIIVENVSNLLAGPSEQRGGWFGRVLGDLASIRYDAEWHCIPASCVGAIHHRDRVWIIAYPQRSNENTITKKQILRKPHLSRKLEGGFEELPRRPSVGEALICRKDDGFPGTPHRLKALGNAVVPQIPELIGNAILEVEGYNGKCAM